MNRLEATFAAARNNGRTVLIPYVTAGDPDLETTQVLIPALVQAGADIIEVGLPSSDPLADGPTIQRSGQRALARGVTRRAVFEMIGHVRAHGVDVPIVLLAYYNCIYRHGEQRFMSEAAAAGIDGIVTPDLPPEEADSLRQAAAKAGIALIPLVAPTSTPERIKLIGEVAQGFIYCVSVTGVTGARGGLSDRLPDFIERVREASGPHMPLAIGFGISDGDQARAAADIADGVIVGSALIQVLEQTSTSSEAVQAGAAFVASLRAALDKSARVGA